jgi:hypothetical protein
MPWESGMLRTGQQYLHALHESPIVWVGNPLITPAIFGNSLRNVVASTNATIARPASHAPLGLLTHLEPHQPGTLARSIFTAWNPEFLRLLNKDLKGRRALPSSTEDWLPRKPKNPTGASNF